MDHHTLAIISISGSCLDVLGALYLAYDLLGGEHGPLRALTRGVTYGLIFAVGYGIALGPVFSIACGVTHGFTLAWEFSLASRGVTKAGFWHDAAASSIRGLGHGIGAASYFGPLFGIVFGVASTAAQIAAYRIGIRPTLDYSAAPRPRVTIRQFLSTVNRTVGYGVWSWWLCVWIAHQPAQAVSFGLRMGLTMGVVTTISIACNPMIEWAADHIPERRMGVLGVGLILAGFALQSVQYWTVLLDVPMK